MTEDEAFALAMQEFEDGAVNPGVLAKAISNSNGDQGKVKASYIKFRAEHLISSDRAEHRRIRQFSSERFFSTGGKIGRREYAVATALNVVIASALVAAADFGSLWQYAGAFVAPTIVALFLTTKRLRDTSVPCWLSLLIVIPWLWAFFRAVPLVGLVALGFAALPPRNR